MTTRSHGSANASDWVARALTGTRRAAAGTDRAAQDGARFLGVYLNDHQAAASGGLALVRRIRDRHTGTEIGTVLAGVARAIDADRRALDAIARHHEVTPAALKHAVARVAEFVSRAKLNGRLLRRSELSTVVELEALLAGIDAKRSLWRSLSAASVAVPPGLDLDELIRGATAQRATLLGLHRAAAASCFARVGER